MNKCNPLALNEYIFHQMFTPILLSATATKKQSHAFSPQTSLMLFISVNSQLFYRLSFMNREINVLISRKSPERLMLHLLWFILDFVSFRYSTCSSVAIILISCWKFVFAVCVLLGRCCALVCVNICMCHWVTSWGKVFYLGSASDVFVACCVFVGRASSLISSVFFFFQSCEFNHASEY